MGTTTFDLKSINSKGTIENGGLLAVQASECNTMKGGTAANMLYNIKRYNAGEREAAEQELAIVIPALVQSGIFDLFPAEEWIEGNNAGRRLVGERALQYMSANKKTGEKKFVFPRFFMI